ncbi:MAG: UDP-N-acetylmuramoyl-tripeptide--D-alanyl-D-alanine ligase [Chloroflexi bacterium]|nr:MAG: UDP-N-acetylmuramoyl-tripeptide--D-alanyl-D-alanine ligase [Chloroflexota bacterium]
MVPRRSRHDQLRAGPVGHAVAACVGLRGDSERRHLVPAIRRSEPARCGWGAPHRAGRGPPRDFRRDGRHHGHHAHDDRRQRDRERGGAQGLQRCREDGHGADPERRRTVRRRRVHLVVRRLCPGDRPADGDCRRPREAPIQAARDGTGHEYVQSDRHGCAPLRPHPAGSALTLGTIRPNVFTLEQLLRATGGRVIHGAPNEDERFVGGAFDSRIAEPGSAFFALRDQRDGHDFVADAFAHGARGAVVERPVPDLPSGALVVQVADTQNALRRLADALRDTHPIPAVGITGNVGKTTTKEATAAALGARYRVLRTASSFNNEIGVPLTFLGIEPSHEVAVIEMGFYVPGEIADLCRLVRPRIGIITRIPDVPVHYSRTPSVDAIAAGKAELIEALPADGVALLNADDARVRALASRTKARVVLFGESGDADLRASDVSARGVEGLRFVAHDGARSVEVQLPLPGRHLVSSALAALGAASSLGVPLAEAAIALSVMDAPAHRMNVRRAANLVVIDDSYNASPAAVMAALAVLGSVSTRRVAVIGDMLELGTLSADAHEAVGREAAKQTDVLVGVGELASTIVTSARSAGLRDTHEVADRAEALVLLRRILRRGDTVLVKGSHSLALDQLADALVQPAART